MSLKLTVFTQTISRDSLKCFTYSEAKTIIIDLKKGVICDSISQIQGLQIVNFKEIITNKDEEIFIKNSQISDKEKNIKALNLKLKVYKKVSKFGIPTALIGGFFLGIYLNK